MIQLKGLDTEQINPRTAHIDQEDTQAMLRLINQEDQQVPLAVEREIPNIARAVDAIYERIASGGRLIYLGRGHVGTGWACWTPRSARRPTACPTRWCRA